jgi:hypothetical protein
MSNLGQPIRIKFIPPIAFSITRQRPVSERPLKPPGRNWPKAFEKRHSELLARRDKGIDWDRHKKNIHEKTTHWFKVIGNVLRDPAILAENVYNMDETGVMLSMPGSVKVLVGKDDMRDCRGVRVKRTTITAIECISADGRYLNPMIIWPATTHRSNWTTFPTPGWQYACTESGYTNSKISYEWLKRIFDPETKERANGRRRVLICDGFGSHQTLEILEFCFENDILLCRLPSHTSHKLQPCDVAAFAPLKAAYREQVDRLERGGVNTIGKEHFTSLYSPVRERAFTPRNIKAGFAASGLFPLNPERVLRGMPKPLAETAIPQIEEVEVRAGFSSQDSVPQTPVTPVSAEALLSLQNVILHKDAHALDEPSKQKLAGHLQKFVKAVRKVSANIILKDEQIKLLNTINNEAKVRRSTRSLVLGKGNGLVMSYEHLEEVRANRLAEGSAERTKGKERRGRKRKSTVLEAPKPSAKVARVCQAPTPARTLIEQMTAAPAVDNDEIVQDIWEAPVARMY